VKPAFRPLAGIKVVDLTRVLAGPWCTQLMADFGADVAKIERIDGGDDTRGWGQPELVDANSGARETTFFLAANRGKRSAAIDVSSPLGAQLVRELAAEADVFIENFKAGGLSQYGLDAASLRALNPRLIYCSITGYGQSGPYAARPGYDYVAQGVGGLMSITGWPDGAPGGGPMRVGAPLVDIMTGLYACNAVIAALHERTVTGVGCVIDLALLDVQLATLSHQALSYLATGENPQRWGNSSPTVAPYDAFATADGHMIITAGNDGQFQRLCQCIGLPALAAEPRFASNAQRVANRAALLPILSERLRQDGTKAWLAILEAAGVAAGPINEMSEVLQDPHVRHRGMQATLPHASLGETPTISAPIRVEDRAVLAERGPPVLGEHTRELLASWLSKTPSQIDQLLREGVAAQT
jgi:crotonobetainyl-CoA:carnitine CoA-transferase CaiB-like acyl-CoA transferase